MNSGKYFYFGSCFWILGRVLDSGKWLVRMSHGKVKYLSRQWGQSPLKVSFETEEQAYDKFHYADVNPFHKVVEQQINNKFTNCFPFRKYFWGTGCAIPFSGDSVPLPVSNPFLPVFVFQYFRTRKIWNLGEVGKQKITLTFSDMQYLSADHTMCWSWDLRE